MNQIKRNIYRFYKRRRRIPTYSELCELCSVSSKNAAYSIAQKLQKEDFLQKSDNGTLVPGILFFSLPHLGSVDAGFPDNPVLDHAEHIAVPTQQFYDPEEHAALSVSGESMNNAGILDDDFIIIQKNAAPKIGDIVVAYVDDGWTVKFLDEREGKPCLVPANPAFPILYPEEQLVIFGKVVAVIRSY